MTGDGKRREAGKSKGTPYKSTYRDVYGHSPLAGDLPSCYGTSEGISCATPQPDRRRRRVISAAT